MTKHAQVAVEIHQKQKILRFASPEIQSAMSVLHPDALTLDYTRLMMGFLLFQTQTRSVLMVGLGGGSILKFCRRHLPMIDFTSIEIAQDVIDLRDEFQIPPDDAMHRIICADGADYVAQAGQSFDVLMVDGFDSQGIPEQLGTETFYQDCFNRLSPEGILVLNLHINHMHADYMSRLRNTFADQVFDVLDEDECNSIVFAFKGDNFAQAPIGNPKKMPHLSKDAWRQLLPEMQLVASAYDLMCG